MATTVAPALGAGLANSMFFSGLPEVMEKRRTGSLGDFNPLYIEASPTERHNTSPISLTPCLLRALAHRPMPIILGNTFGWTVYSLLTHDAFVAAANAPGLLLASWYVMTTCRLADAGTAQRIEKVAMAMAAIHVVTALACAFWLPSRQAMISLCALHAPDT